MNEHIDNLYSTVKQKMDELQQQRDELKVQAKLGAMEARQEWEALDKKYAELKTSWLKGADQLRDEIETTAQQDVQAVKDKANALTQSAEAKMTDLADTLKADFAKLKAQLKG